LSDAHDLNLLAAHVEDRLDDEERARLTTHLAGCAECRETLALLARAGAEARLLPPIRGRFGRLPRRVWLPLAASLFVAAALVGPLYLRLPQEGPPPLDERLLLKRGGERQAAGKTFRLVAGEWIDAAFDPGQALPTVVVSGADERASLLSRRPGLAPYAALGERVLVVFEGTVYRFTPPEAR
jgi:anti-sigma factor RsiW